MAATQPFKVLYVCTGNIARSPLAAACTWDLVSSNGSGVAWEVSSAGTNVVDGDGVRPEISRVAASLGIDLDSHRAQPLDPAACEASDLILGMSWDQVAHIWSVAPDAWGKSFTLKEFVHWAKQTPARPPILFPNKVEQMRDKIDRAHSVRKRARSDHGFWGGLRPQDLNLIEPVGRSDTAWRNLGQAVRVLVTDAIRLVGGP